MQLLQTGENRDQTSGSLAIVLIGLHW